MSRVEIGCDTVQMCVEFACPGLWAVRQALGPAGFGDVSFRAYKRLFGVDWDRKGEFVGTPRLQVNGGRDYRFELTDPPFGFKRYTGRGYYPLGMVTDGGSVPRVAWCIPGLNPWDYMPAFLIHDWHFVEHHCRPGGDTTFEDANLILAEGVYTLMKAGVVQEDWRLVEIIYKAVSSSIGRDVWDRVWTPGQCSACLGG